MRNEIALHSDHSADSVVLEAACHRELLSGH